MAKQSVRAEVNQLCSESEPKSQTGTHGWEGDKPWRYDFKKKKRVWDVGAGSSICPKCGNRLVNGTCKGTGAKNCHSLAAESVRVLESPATAQSSEFEQFVRGVIVEGYLNLNMAENPPNDDDWTVIEGHIGPQATKLLAGLKDNDPQVVNQIVESAKQFYSTVRESKDAHRVGKPRKVDGEWIVPWFVNGKKDDGKTYYTNDKKDAEATYADLVKRAAKMNGVTESDDSAEGDPSSGQSYEPGDSIWIDVGDKVKSPTYGEFWVTSLPGGRSIWTSERREDIDRGTGRGLRYSYVNAIQKGGRGPWYPVEYDEDNLYYVQGTNESALDRAAKWK